MHNLYTLRGAQVRDALVRSKHLPESLDLFGERAKATFAGHHWPRWGGEDIRRQLADQRDMYRFIHDQTMRLANQGHVGTEIAEMLRLPEELDRQFFNLTTTAP